MPIKSPKSSYLILAASLMVFAGAPCSGADEESIRKQVQSSEIVPLDYRQQISIACTEDGVSISVYKDPESDAKDCKIDAVLIANKVIEAAPSTKTVSVFFYDLTADDKLIRVDVPTKAVRAFAEGQLDKGGILKAAKLSLHAGNTLADSYAGQTYKQIVERLGVIEGPSQQQRAVTLVRINELASRNQNTTDLRRRYLHIEDLARRGSLTAMRAELKALNDTLDQFTQIDRDAKLTTLSGSSKPSGDSPGGVAQ
jgi:hypothetical protein